ncbi:hypothetical protein RIF29_18936 [Crotalaria pallida]|uniref:Uncharacterized protein n=1 Tax=Crotalaria pallida TaxID=3830 RepID=A0AAN9F244_CROPI
MVIWKLALFCMCVILATSSRFLLCGANNEEDRKAYIIYMGSLPKEEDYSPTSHHLSMLQQVVGGAYFATNSLITSYKRSFNGFAAKLTDQEAQNLARMEGVVSVFESKTMELHTTRSWDFLGFQETTTQETTSPIESDIIIGVIDSGIWPESDSFNDKGFGPPPKKWKGTCAGGNNFTCNNKIIGARYYGDKNDSARDDIGHGSHTASTAAGNKVKDVSFYGIAKGIARGGVPSARIAVYKPCKVGCNIANVLAAFDDAIADGVDLITASLGASTAFDFFEDPIAIGSFHAMEKGILAIQSAGNSGPRKGLITSVAPWLLSVAASSTDRKIIDKISLGNGVTLTGKSVNAFTSNGTKIPLVSGARASADPNCLDAIICTPFCLDQKQIKGKVVLCSSPGGLETGYQFGAFGAIVEYAVHYSLVVPFPALALDSKAYNLALSYANSSNSPHVEILRSETIKDIDAPLVVEFSSRGPNSIVGEIMKPDVSAPGVDILAAFSPTAAPSDIRGDKRSVKYNILSGTSMSCPHVAGIAAYVKSFHPDWSPAAIKSSIMTTAKPMKGTQDKEFAYGSGHVNPLQAINPGLIFNLSKVDYAKLLCNIGYDTKKVRQISGDDFTCPPPQRSMVKDINYPALAIQVKPMQPFEVNFTRTVTNVGFAKSTYKVNVVSGLDLNVTIVPKVLTFKSLEEKQSFNVSVSGKKNLSGSVLSSSLVWTDGAHSVRVPIVVDVSEIGIKH